MPELLERFDMANSCATILCMRSPDFEKRASGRSLLVVEDDADIREALDGLLSMEGFRVAGCSNGREALDWLRASPKPDIILLDLMMPIMDGWQFRVAQKDDPELATIPVLALSADSTAKAAAIDAEAYLKKPVDYDTLIATIDRLLVESEHREIQARLAQTDRLTSLGTLAVGVAHEINNPLAYVLLNFGYVSEELPKLLSSRRRGPRAWLPCPTTRRRTAPRSPRRLRARGRCSSRWTTRATAPSASATPSAACRRSLAPRTRCGAPLQLSSSSTRRCRWWPTRFATARASSRSTSPFPTSSRTRHGSARSF